MFLNPLLLAAGLAALAIPVVLHLQRRRQKVRVVFSSLRLVEECQRITRKRRKIVDWLILLLRLAAVGLLALAFARPWIASLAGPPMGGRESIVFVLDRSASMQARGEVGPVWEEAADGLKRALRRTSPNSRVALITTPSVEPSFQITWTTPARLLRQLSDIKPSFGRSNLSSALQQAGSALERIENDLPKVVHLVSDLQADATRKIDDVSLAGNVGVRVAKVGDLNPDNAGLSASAVGKGELRRGAYRLHGVNESSHELGVVEIQDFAFDGEAIAEPNERVLKSLSFSQSYKLAEKGWYSRRVKLRREDALALDNEALDVFYVREPVNVLLIEPRIKAKTYDQTTFFLSRALDPFLGVEDPRKRPTRFRPKAVSPPQAAQEIRRLRPENSVVFAPPLDAPQPSLAIALKQFVAAGGGVVFLAGPKLDVANYNEQWRDWSPVELGPAEPIASRATLRHVGPKHPLWEGLDEANRLKMARLPLFQRFQAKPKPSAEVLAHYSDGTPLIAKARRQQGRVLFVNTSADRRWSDWPTLAGSFVPTVHVLAGQALPKTTADQDADARLVCEPNLYFSLGPRYKNASVKINDMAAQADSDGQVRIDNAAPAIYTATDENGQVIRRFAVNLDPRESNLESVQAVVVKRQLESQRMQVNRETIASIATKESDGFIWKSLLTALAALLAIEPFLANFRKEIS